MKKEPVTKIDIGHAIRQKINEYGIKVAWLARQIGCDRGNLSRHLDKEHIDPELLLKISIVLKTDFFAFYSDCIRRKVTVKQEYIPLNFDHKVHEIDIGHAVRQKMSEFSSKNAWLARQIDCDPSNLQKRLKKKHIYPEYLLNISIILKTDFFVCYSHCVTQSIKNESDRKLLIKNSHD